MEHFDSQMAARVWQRVQNISTPEEPTADILLLLQEELTELHRYNQLSGALDSTAKPLLQQLIKLTQQSAAVLRGIYFLLTDTSAQSQPYPLPKELPVSALRRSYGTTLSRISRYGHWSTHPEYGPGFLQLTNLSRQRCQLLLQLLGSMRL